MTATISKVELVIPTLDPGQCLRCRVEGLVKL